MPPLATDDATLLDAWEATTALARPWRELALLAGVSGEPVDALARLPIGERDRRLLALRVAKLGDRLDCETVCPACGERLEMALVTSALECAPVEPGGTSVLEHGDWRIRFRLPTSADLAACIGEPATGQALLARCVVEAAHHDAPRPPQALRQALPDDLRDALAARMAELDPQADVRLALDCPACGHGWQADLDIGGFVLAEVDAHATRLLSEVHGLASAYGWREADILALSPARRRRYLELAWS
jgi:hypothetical protein